MKDRLALLEEFYMAWRVLHVVSDNTDYAEERRRLHALADELEKTPLLPASQHGPVEIRDTEDDGK